MLLVYDVVTGSQLQRIDHVATPRRQPPHVLGRRALAGQVGLCDDGELQRGDNDAVIELPGGDGDDVALWLRGQARCEPGRHTLATQHFDEALRRAVPLTDVDEPPVIRKPAFCVGQRSLRVAAVRLRGANPGRNRVLVQLLVDRERTDRPPRDAARHGVLAHLCQGPVGRVAQVDGDSATAGCGGPRRLEELLAGRNQVSGAGSDPLGVTQQDVGVFGQEVDEQLQPVDERRCKRLHPLDGDALGELEQHVGDARLLLRKRSSSVAYLVGQQQLATWGRPHAMLGDLEGALVGDLEVAHLLNGVAPELHAQRVFLGRRKHIENAAANSEVAALLDQVGTGIGGVGERLDRSVQLDLVARLELDRNEVTETGDLRLKQAPDGRHHHIERTGHRIARTRMRQPTQHRKPPTDRVGARAQPLVRQRLPRREDGHPILVEETRQRRSQILRFPAGRGHGEHRPAGRDSPARQPGTGGARPDR